MISRDDPADGRGHVHRRLVGLERDQRVLGGDRVADRDEDLDHGHVGEVADVRDLDLRSVRSRRHTVVGIGASGSIS